MEMTNSFPMIKYNGFVIDAVKEMVEASLFYEFEIYFQYYTVSQF